MLPRLEFKGNAIGARMGLSEGPTMEEVEPVFQNLDRRCGSNVCLLCTMSDT